MISPCQYYWLMLSNTIQPSKWQRTPWLTVINQSQQHGGWPHLTCLPSPHPDSGKSPVNRPTSLCYSTSGKSPLLNQDKECPWAYPRTFCLCARCLCTLWTCGWCACTVSRCGRITYPPSHIWERRRKKCVGINDEPGALSSLFSLDDKASDQRSHP